jgi:hypothetical protein
MKLLINYIISGFYLWDGCPFEMSLNEVMLFPVKLSRYTPIYAIGAVRSWRIRKSNAVSPYTLTVKVLDFLSE